MQLPLELKLPVKATLEDFVASNKSEIKAAFNSLVKAENHSFIFLWSQPGQGKTHLLSALCQLAESHNDVIAYLPLKQADEFPVEICEGLEHSNIICIDDIDVISGNKDWEIALFNLYNRIKDNDHKLIVTADCSPGSLTIQLPDLKSRLSWGISLAVPALDDAQKKMVLQKKAQASGMVLQSDTADYLLTHHSRSLKDLTKTLTDLEHATLVAKRKLTIPFVRDFLQIKSSQS